jgi:hypothetical protein
VIELLVLIAIAYAGARGVESLTGTTDRRHDTAEARETVEKIAADKPKDTATEKPAGPTEPGGTFSKAAPRSAKIGGTAAVPLAVITETGSTMWRAIGEGYRERWPEIRAERRRQMTERAVKRKTERVAAEAKRKADAAVGKAGPPPPFPPAVAPLVQPSTAPEPASGPSGALGGTAKVPAQQTPSTPRHLAAVPDPAQNGDLMSSPSTIIPEIRTLDGLMNALTLVRAMCEMRAEEALAIAADDLSLSNRLDQIEAEMAELEVDPTTRAEVDGLRESIHAQSQAAAQYGGAAKDAADLALATAQAAHKNHGGIAEAVQSSPIEVAAQAGYYNR